MKEEITGLVRNLAVFYIIFTSVIQLVPNKKYERYVRNFMALLLIYMVCTAVFSIMGKTAQITAKEIKKDKKIRHHRKLCYESCNTAVATVTPEGLIQAVGKGTCTIWVYAQNGVYVALTVTVK